ncbi:hypothetical protein [Trinickia dinghuensis]|uniref:Flavin reductase n=1 Tax=Trinickia dinghuensis TaxID=2291023 RepID=A0A3D8K3I7_9BURK|nr:hypothetical protein [Trinickia dinghuensis]RDU99789.1 hypothetical protein DWV00_05080 [Trinickia dinghuensis]
MSSSVEPPARALDQRTFDEWPPELRALFDGEALASKIGFTASLITCDAGGHLRTSLLGIGELYAPDATSLAFALWPSSRAARTLGSLARDTLHTTEFGHHGHKRAHAALTFVHEGAFHQVQLEVEPLPLAGSGTNEAGCGLALFIASIDVGEAQRVGYARLTGGIAFELSGPASEQQTVLARWERQIGELRQAADR